MGEDRPHGHPHLYHWTHLELKRYFGIDELFPNPLQNGHQANEQLASPEFSARNILNGSGSCLYHGRPGGSTPPP